MCFWLKRSLACAAVLLAFGCDGDGGDGGPEVVYVPVTITYTAATELDPSIRTNHLDCLTEVSVTHIHASWERFGIRLLEAEGADTWTMHYDAVPAGIRHRIRINDPNLCDTVRLGTATKNVYANGVALEEVVDTPGLGVEPGLAFTVDANGTVTP